MDELKPRTATERDPRVSAQLIAQERARYMRFHLAAYGIEAPESELTDEHVATLIRRRWAATAELVKRGDQ